MPTARPEAISTAFCGVLPGKKRRLPIRRIPIARMSVMYSCPMWLTERLAEQYGQTSCRRILEDSHRQYPPTLRVNRLKTTGAELVQTLLEEGIKTRQDREDPWCLYVDGPLHIQSSPAYQKGLYTVQNTSSMEAVRTLAPLPGETVMDVCAAPGGKTTQMAECMEDRGRILAFDIHPHKIGLIQAAADRLGLTCVEAAEQDAALFQPELEKGADRVLADVPCSGIGVIHKKPGYQMETSGGGYSRPVSAAKKILDTVCRYVKDGGTLVYSTCTILREENQDQAAWFAETHPDFHMESERQILTCETGGSGFYIAKFVRTK